jgi:hypothetical protein
VARSKNGRQHFKHFRNSHPDNCVFHNQGRPQTRHTAAKVLLCTLFREALNRRVPTPLFRFDTPNGSQFVLPFFTATRVVNEWTCPLTPRRADLALLDSDGRPALLIEVWHTNAVNRDKRQDLTPYWWIEVDANQVLSDSTVLQVRAHDNLPEVLALAWQQFKLFDSVAID